MTPVDDHRQATLDSQLIIRPATPVWTYRDYWGTDVSVFDVTGNHRTLSIESVSRVDTSPVRPLAGRCRGRCSRPSAGRWPSCSAPPSGPRSPAGGRGRPGHGRRPHETAEAIAWAVHERVEYVPGATGVPTSAQEAWDQGKGVCQDMAHLTVALMRAAGPRPDASPATSTRWPTRPSGRPSRGSRTRGWSTGRASGTRSTRQTAQK